MNDAAFREKTAALVREEHEGHAGWWWCSFAQDGFRGVCIVFAYGIITASREAHLRGINPGGEMLAYEIAEPPDEFKNALLDSETATRASTVVKPPARKMGRRK
jgi:hypothetical protein